MLQEFRKSIQLILYERVTSPLSGALIFSWFVWNWKIPYLLLFDNAPLPFSEKLNYVELKYLSVYFNLVYPIFSALFLTTIYPFATTGILNIWLRFRVWQNTIKNKIEKNQLLTLEQSIQLRSELASQRQEMAKLISSKDEEIRALVTQRDSVIDENNKLKQGPNGPSQAAVPQAFDSSRIRDAAIDQNRSAVLADLTTLAQKAQRYYFAPVVLTGGGNSFVGLTADATGLGQLASTAFTNNVNGTYTIKTAGTATTVVFHGVGKTALNDGTFPTYDMTVTADTFVATKIN